MCGVGDKLIEKMQQLIALQVVVRDYRGMIYLPADSCFLVYNTRERKLKKYSKNIFFKKIFFLTSLSDEFLIE